MKRVLGFIAIAALLTGCASNQGGPGPADADWGTGTENTLDTWGGASGPGGIYGSPGGPVGRDMGTGPAGAGTGVTGTGVTGTGGEGALGIGGAGGGGATGAGGVGR